MKAYKQSKRVSRVNVSQQTEPKPSTTALEDRFNWTELRDSIQMVMQDFDFSLCLRGLTTLRLITSQNVPDQSNLFSYTAILIESGTIERLNQIIQAHESEFGSDAAEVLPQILSESEEPCSKLLSGKEESIGILINLSFGSEAQVNSLVKRGCIEVLC